MVAYLYLPSPYPNDAMLPTKIGSVGNWAIPTIGCCCIGWHTASLLQTCCYFLFGPT